MTERINCLDVRLLQHQEVCHRTYCLTCALAERLENIVKANFYPSIEAALQSDLVQQLLDHSDIRGPGGNPLSYPQVPRTLLLEVIARLRDLECMERRYYVAVGRLATEPQESDK